MNRLMINMQHFDKVMAELAEYCDGYFHIEMLEWEAQGTVADSIETIQHCLENFKRICTIEIELDETTMWLQIATYWSMTFDNPDFVKLVMKELFA